MTILLTTTTVLLAPPLLTLPGGWVPDPGGGRAWRDPSDLYQGAFSLVQLDNDGTDVYGKAAIATFTGLRGYTGYRVLDVREIQIEGSLALLRETTYSGDTSPQLNAAELYVERSDGSAWLLRAGGAVDIVNIGQLVAALLTFSPAAADAALSSEPEVTC